MSRIFFNQLKTFYLVFLLLISAFFGSAYILPIIVPCFFLFPTKFFNLIIDKIIGWWLSFLPSCVELILGAKVHLYGEKIDDKTNSLILLNHRCQLDWFFFIHVAVKHQFLDQFKIVLKESLKYIPGVGSATQTAMFLFLKRIYQDDKSFILQWCSFVKSYRKRIHLLMFPEGTDFSLTSVASSNKYALKNGLPLYNYVLHPKVKGFNSFMEGLSYDVSKGTLLEPIKFVYDVTVAYDDTESLTWVDVFSGRHPRGIHFFIKKYDSSFF